MPEPILLDEHLFRSTLQRPDMTLEALFRGIYKQLSQHDDAMVTAFHAFRVGCAIGRSFPAETDRLDREWKRRAERELRERGTW